MPRHRTRAALPNKAAEGDHNQGGALSYSQRQYRARLNKAKVVEQAEADAIAEALAEELPDVTARVKQAAERLGSAKKRKQETTSRDADREPLAGEKLSEEAEETSAENREETGEENGDEDTMPTGGSKRPKKPRINRHPGVVAPPPAEPATRVIPDGMRPQYLAIFKAVHNLLSAGMTRDRVIESVGREFARLELTDDEIDEIVTRVHRRWVANLAIDLPVAKAAQVERLMRDLVRMRAHNHPNYLAINAHETLVSKILGTQQAIRVEVSADVRVRQQILAVVSGLTQEEQDRIIAEEMGPPRLPTSNR